MMSPPPNSLTFITLVIPEAIITYSMKPPLISQARSPLLIPSKVTAEGPGWLFIRAKPEAFVFTVMVANVAGASIRLEGIMEVLY